MFRSLGPEGGQFLQLQRFLVLLPLNVTPPFIVPLPLGSIMSQNLNIPRGTLSGEGVYTQTQVTTTRAHARGMSAATTFLHQKR